MATKKPTDRVKRTNNQRGAAQSAPARADRAGADDDRKEEATALSAADRATMLRNEFLQEALPSVPKIAGWHVCWLATNSSYDPIHKRMRLGYVPVKAAELPGFDQQFNVKEGEWSGCISCNEMILFKVPEQVYQEIMMLFHHTMPMEEEQRIKETLKQAPGADKTTDVELEEGFRDLAVAKRGKFM
jgi:hypothetical protein